MSLENWILLCRMNKSDILLSSINTFYTVPENKHILIELLNKSGGISLRNLEWFITNYSKKTNLAYQTGDGKIFSVHCAYKSSLDGYSKKLFDPFCAKKLDRSKEIHRVSSHTTRAQGVPTFARA